MKFIGRLIWKLIGWKWEGEFPEGVDKCVLVAAPHTSNWDFFLGKTSMWMQGRRVKFLIKKEAFIFPFGPLLKMMGGIPVDRRKNNNLTDQAAEIYKTKDQIDILFTPEGTRKKVNRWKKGFYYVALKANVPIVLGFMDYPNKIGGVGPVVYPSGDYEKDMEFIMNYYKQFSGKYSAKGVS